MKPVLRDLIFAIVLTILFFFGGGKAYSDIEVSLPDTSAESGDTIAIPVRVSEIVTNDSVYSFEMTLTFNSLVLVADSAYTTAITQGWAFEYNDSAGQIFLGGYDVYPLSGSGALVYIVFIVHGLQGDTTIIHFDKIWLNETPPTIITDGRFEVSPGSDVKDENEFPGRPTELTLFQNYPNPFNPVTIIQYALPHDCEVDVSIYNILGQKVKTLVKRKQKAGYQQVIWDGENNEGEEIASGIYFYKIKAGELTESKKMVIIK